MNQVRRNVLIGIAHLYFVLCAGMAIAQTQTAHRVQVILSAQEAAVRTSVANLDIYSIRIQPKNSPAFEGIALDRYPNYEEGMPSTFIAQDQPISMRLRRTPYCDRMGTKINRGEAASLPCFTVVHGSWKASRRMPVGEMWWK
ncbi:MAG TPA: hypothetical protein VK638_37620 [Edaphobacter sp.]|nr:hypothetical protein [Edaphobacter sp.]